jgi:hypothetical protein
VGNLIWEPSAEEMWHDFMEVSVHGKDGRQLRIVREEVARRHRAGLPHSRMIVCEDRLTWVHQIDTERIILITDIERRGGIGFWQEVAE